MRSPRIPLVLLLAIALTGFVAACGASGGDDADATTTTGGTKTTTTAKRSTTTAARRTTTTDSSTTTTGGGGTPTTLARTAEAETYVEALAGTLKEDGSEVFDKAQATCLAGAYVDAIGIDTLRSAGLSPSDFAESNGDNFDGKITLTEAMGNQVFDRFAPCGIDLVQLFRQISGIENPTQQQDACFDQLLTTANLRRSFVADYTGQNLDQDPLDQLQSCVKGDG